MQAERWKRIEDLCQAALELAPEKRAVFLARACADPQLALGGSLFLVPRPAPRYS